MNHVVVSVKDVLSFSCCEMLAQPNINTKMKYNGKAKSAVKAWKECDCTTLTSIDAVDSDGEYLTTDGRRLQILEAPIAPKIQATRVMVML